MDVSSTKARFHEGDVLFGKLRPNLRKSALAPFEGVCSTDILVFRVNPGVDAAYLSFLTHSTPFTEHAVRSIGGVNLPRTSWTALREFKFVLPPLPEQRAIAAALRAVQDARDARRRELALERERKAALMDDLFTRGTRGEPCKETETGPLPQSWRLSTLGELCKEDNGYVQTGPFGSQLHASDYKPTGVPVVNPTHLGLNVVNEERLPRISVGDADRLSRHYLKKGDILISRRGDLSKYSYVAERQDGWLCGTGCLLIRLQNPEVDNLFVALSFSTAPVQRYLKDTSVGSIMPNLNTRILFGVRLALPTITEQRDIAEVLTACDRKIAALESEVAVQDELFRALLEELMTGRLSALPLVETKTRVTDQIGAERW